MYPYFEVFGNSIPTYLISIIIGIFFAIGLALICRRTARRHISAEDVVFTILCCMVGAIVGAKLFQVIGHIVQDGGTTGFWTIQNFIQMIPGVGVFYGGLLGGLAAGIIYVRVCKLNFFDVADLIIPSVLLFHAFGRIGCFLAGCCYGITAPWGIEFINSSMAPNNVPLVPIQLFEAGFDIIIMMAFLIIRPERKRPGILLPLYIIVYAIGRFVIEFFRGDIGRGVFLLSTSQWISLLIFPIGILMLRWVTKQNAMHIENIERI